VLFFLQNVSYGIDKESCHILDDEWFLLHVKLPYILESNLHPFSSFRGLKNQMRIRIECGLDSRSRAAKIRCRLNLGAD
jgi:hypothetical protein